MNTPSPDYGEPWEATNLHFLTTKGNFSTGVLASLHSKRIAQCVNACQGMADPAAEIEAMRDKLVDIRQRLNGHADSKLNGEYGLAAATMRGFEILQADNEAMLDAIKEAHKALKAWPKAGSGMSTDFTAQSEAFRTGQCAIAKLQPFIKP